MAFFLGNFVGERIELIDKEGKDRAGTRLPEALVVRPNLAVPDVARMTASGGGERVASRGAPRSPER